MLDRTEQRILGVLMEKELAVPDSYPMTENALLVGCNQKSNRDPEMALEAFEVAGALMSLIEKRWVTKIEGGRAARYRHEATKRLALGPKQQAVLTELLVRGPQAPGALKPRVARMGFDGTPEEVETVLRGLGERDEGALVEQQPKRPRERDERWAHCLGPRAETAHTEATEPLPRATARPTPAPPPTTPALHAVHAPDLELRVAQLESELGSLREEIDELRRRLESGRGHFTAD